jgi:two-component system chemotaxis response regulator CheY
MDTKPENGLQKQIAQKQTSSAAPSNPLQPVDLKKVRVMLVEDQPDTSKMIKNMLMEIGVTQVYTSPDGQKALEFMDSANDFIDLIMCDWNMPRVTGIELLRQLRTAYPTLPFIMVTARGDIESVIVAKEAGVSGFIRKPFSLDELKAKLVKTMAKSAAGPK